MMKSMRSYKYGLSLATLFLFLSGREPLFGQDNPAAVRILSQYRPYQEAYYKKAKRYFLKYLKKDHGIGVDYNVVKNYNLQYYPIPIFDARISYADTSNIYNLFNHLKLNKRYKPMVLVSKDSSYFGDFIFTPADPFPVASKIVLKFFNDRVVYDEFLDTNVKSWFEVIQQFKPDIVFCIAHTSLNLIMIKDNKFYFIGYFNGSLNLAVEPEEWQKDLRERRKTVWYKLLYKKVFR